MVSSEAEQVVRHDNQQSRLRHRDRNLEIHAEKPVDCTSVAQAHLRDQRTAKAISSCGLRHALHVHEFIVSISLGDPTGRSTPRVQSKIQDEPGPATTVMRTRQSVVKMVCQANTITLTVPKSHVTVM